MLSNDNKMLSGEKRMIYKTKIKKQGNHFFMTFPKEIVKEQKITNDQIVKLKCLKSGNILKSRNILISIIKRKKLYEETKLSLKEQGYKKDDIFKICSNEFNDLFRDIMEVLLIGDYAYICPVK